MEYALFSIILDELPLSPNSLFVYVSGLFQMSENEGHYQTLPLYTVLLLS